MMLNKKAVELPLNAIIIAAIALIVLVVIVFILTGRLNVFGTSLEDCISKTGQNCKPACATGETPIPGTNCDKTNQVCCLRVIGR